MVRDGPAPRRAYVATDAGLIALPERPSGLVPRAPFALFGSALLPASAKARLALEPMLAAFASEPAGPSSVAAFVDRRLGRQTRERLVDPMLRAIYGVESDRLDLDATMPHLRSMVRDHGSLGLGVLRASRKPAPGGLVTLRGGMDGLVRRLAEVVGAGRIRLGTPVVSIARASASALRLETPRGPIDVDAAIVAVPSWRAAELLAQVAPQLAAELASIAHVSTDVVTLAYPRSAVRHALDGTGHVVASTGARTRACTWASEKWHARAPGSHVLLRSVLDAPGASDDELVAMARAEAEPLLDIRACPVLSRVRRRARALPVPGVGHLALRERLHAHAVASGSLRLAGGATGGLGVPDCLATGLSAAAEITA